MLEISAIPACPAYLPVYIRAKTKKRRVVGFNYGCGTHVLRSAQGSGKLLK
jgi:hypothetical protein